MISKPIANLKVLTILSFLIPIEGQQTFTECQIRKKKIQKEFHSHAGLCLLQDLISKYISNSKSRFTADSEIRDLRLVKEQYQEAKEMGLRKSQQMVHRIYGLLAAQPILPARTKSAQLPKQMCSICQGLDFHKSISRNS